MKIRLTLALIFACTLGASAYYTGKKPAGPTQPVNFCCSGDPNTIILPLPTPTPTPQPGN